MPRGFALVAVRDGRRGGENKSAPFQEALTKIRTALQQDSRIKAVNEITRRYGGEILPAFKVRVDVDAPDLPDAFKFIEKTLHDAGHSHVEGYEGGG